MPCRVCIIAAILLVPGLQLRAADVESLRTQIAQVVPSAGAVLGTSTLAHGGSEALQSIYSATGNAPVWIREGRATPQAAALLRELQNAESYGLEAKDYRGIEIAQLLEVAPSSGVPDDAQWAQFDVTLSAAALHFVSDLYYGRVAPEAAGFKWREDHPPLDLATVLKDLASTSDVPHVVASVEPAFYHYGLLKDALARLRKVLQQQDFAQLPPPPARLKVGDAYAGAPALRRILATIGDLADDAIASPADATFDANLSAAVRKYQLRHGLAANGALDKATFAELRTPPAQRIRQITLTLERWRWLTPFKTPPIIVNIPQFRLFAFRTTETFCKWM
jgi:murein L,D-transpeptidase YcbB/YkuD